MQRFSSYTAENSRDGEQVALAAAWRIQSTPDGSCASRRAARERRVSVTGATTFEAAVQTLAERPPHLLIAAERLGPSTACIWCCAGGSITPDGGDRHGGGEGSGARGRAAFGASCAVAPRNSTELFALVTRIFAMRSSDARRKNYSAENPKKASVA
jgi:hypothetical protein